MGTKLSLLERGECTAVAVAVAIVDLIADDTVVNVAAAVVDLAAAVVVVDTVVDTSLAVDVALLLLFLVLILVLVLLVLECCCCTRSSCGIEFASCLFAIVTLAYLTVSIDYHESILSVCLLLYLIESFRTSSTAGVF